MTNTGGSFTVVDYPHRRFNPLTGCWVLVSPHRAKRPWSGLTEKTETAETRSYDESCPLCPGNTRAGNTRNPDYEGTFVFSNDFAALNTNSLIPAETGDDLFGIQSATGENRVICFSADHSKTLPELPVGNIRQLINTWCSQVAELSKTYPWVQIFENKGSMMGASQPHPHNQVWASSFIPNEIAIRDKMLKRYFEEKGTNLLFDYGQRELADGTRVLFENETWIALVPFWATWPFETMLLPKAHRARFDDLGQSELDDLAVALKALTIRYDNLFQCSFPYSMGWHYAPYPAPYGAPHEDATEHWQIYAVFYPPLLRSATVRKFMVGYEMLAEAQRDITPEQAAEKLRTQSQVHYKEQDSS
ncbi:MAG: UDP-glucose--hexose-1-phosphate uridylyltransferase [bacterium]|nr:UDP-glucose--hexose-1-phosphate uridylyltransferase [Gammaproteobacteria bacterium]HIL97871.1 UDP-glucose--hexose-1-phosphate uridylyltransferase [Pseudomonadales bacterium]